jgi:hypothetical protein
LEELLLDPQVLAGTDHVGFRIDVGIPLPDLAPILDAVPVCNPDQGVGGGYFVLDPTGPVGFGTEVPFAAGDVFQFVQVQFVVSHFFSPPVIVHRFFSRSAFLPLAIDYTQHGYRMAVKQANWAITDQKDKKLPCAFALTEPSRQFKVAGK